MQYIVGANTHCRVSGLLLGLYSLDSKLPDAVTTKEQEVMYTLTVNVQNP